MDAISDRSLRALTKMIRYERFLSVAKAPKLSPAAIQSISDSFRVKDVATRSAPLAATALVEGAGCLLDSFTGRITPEYLFWQRSHVFSHWTPSALTVIELT